MIRATTLRYRNLVFFGTPKAETKKLAELLQRWLTSLLAHLKQFVNFIFSSRIFFAAPPTFYQSFQFQIGLRFAFSRETLRDFSVIIIRDIQTFMHGSTSCMHGGRGKFRKGRKIPEVTWYVWATCAKRESLSHAPVARIYIRNDSTDATRCSSSPHEFQSN